MERAMGTASDMPRAVSRHGHDASHGARIVAVVGWDMALLGDVGWIALTFVGFSFTVAIVLPVVLALIRQIGLFVWLRLPVLSGIPDDRRVLPHFHGHFRVGLSEP
jgi:hypothetical protein